MSEDREEPFSDLVVLINIVVAKAAFAIVSLVASSSCESLVSLIVISATDATTTSAKSGDDEEISDEEMSPSYKVMYEKLMDAVNENRAAAQENLSTV